MTIYCGRDFSAEDIQMIRDLMQENPHLKRSPLSRILCQLWNWVKPNGELKDMTCRVALLRMPADGLFALAPSVHRSSIRRPAHLPATPASDPQAPINAPVTGAGWLARLGSGFYIRGGEPDLGDCCHQLQNH